MTMPTVGSIPENSTHGSPDASRWHAKDIRERTTCVSEIATIVGEVVEAVIHARGSYKPNIFVVGLFETQTEMDWASKVDL